MGISVEAWRSRIGCYIGHSYIGQENDQNERRKHWKEKWKNSKHREPEPEPDYKGQNVKKSSNGVTEGDHAKLARKVCLRHFDTFIPNLKGLLSAGMRLLLLIGLLLVMAGDVEKNPGPRNGTETGHEETETGEVSNGNEKIPTAEDNPTAPLSDELTEEEEKEKILKYENVLQVYVERGKEPFQRGEFDVSAEQQSRAIEFAERVYQQKNISLDPELVAMVYCNRCMCFFEMGHYLMAMRDFHKVLLHVISNTVWLQHPKFLSVGDMLLIKFQQQIQDDRNSNEVEEAKKVIEFMKKDGIEQQQQPQPGCLIKALAIFAYACKLARLLKHWTDEKPDIIIADLNMWHAETLFKLVLSFGLPMNAYQISKKCTESLNLTEGVRQSEDTEKIRQRAHYYKACCLCDDKMYEEAAKVLKETIAGRGLEKEIDELTEKCESELTAMRTSETKTTAQEEWLDGTNIAQNDRAKVHQEKVIKQHHDAKASKTDRTRYKQVLKRPDRENLATAQYTAPPRKTTIRPQKLKEPVQKCGRNDEMDKFADTSLPRDGATCNTQLEYQFTNRVSGSRESHEVQQVKARFPLKDRPIQLGCSKCCKEWENSGEAFCYTKEAHEKCPEDRLLIQHSDGKWIWIRPPSIIAMCNKHLHGKLFSFPPEKCKYAHSREELALWKKDGADSDFQVIDFIQDLRSAYHPKPKSPRELMQKYGGKLVFVCQRCFFMHPPIISRKVKDQDSCEKGHRWKVEGTLLVHENIVGTRKNRVPIRKRPAFSGSDLYKRCLKAICSDDVKCPYAHSDIEQDVWNMEQSKNWTRGEFIKNLKTLNSDSKKTKTEENILGTLMENTDVFSGGHMRRDSVSSLCSTSDDSEVKCKERVEFTCRKCYIRNRNKIVGPSPDYEYCKAGLHPWNPDTFLCVAHQTDGKIAEIRDLPDVIRGHHFELCAYMKRSQNRCPFGKECKNPHSNMEKSLWEWMQKHQAFSLEELVIASGRAHPKSKTTESSAVARGHPTSARFLSYSKYYCKYCHTECNSKMQLERHFSSPRHRGTFARLSRSDQSWNCREPPPNMSSFEKCKRHFEEDETCEFSGVEDHLNHCPFAHSEEELGEWKQRVAQKIKLRELMKESKVYPYLKQIHDEYIRVKGSNKEDKMIVYHIKGIEITPDPLSPEGKKLLHQQFQKKEENHTFNITVNAKNVDLKLEKASLLLFKHRDHFCIETEDGATVQLIAGDAAYSDVENNIYEFRVTFKTFIYGAFEQVLLLDFGQRPFLAITLKVDVGTEHVLKKRTKAEQTEFIKDIVDYIPYPSEPSPLEEIVQKNVHELGDQYNLPTLFGKKELSRQNYVNVMHQLLKFERKEQSDLVKRCGMKIEVQVIDVPQSFKHIKGDKHLIAKIPLDENILQFGSESVKLLLTSVSRAYIQSPPCPPDSEPNFYEAVVVNYQDYLSSGQTRDSIYLALSEHCCKELSLVANSGKDLVVHFKLDDTNFQLEHLALGRLDANLGVFFPDYTRSSPLGECLPGELEGVSNLEEKKIEILKNVLSESCVDGGTCVPPTIIMGAFGTGKTYILQRAVAVLMKNTEKRILICCKFDSAADLYVSFIEDQLKKRGRQASKRDHPLRIYGIEKEMNFKDIKYSVCTKPSEKLLAKHRVVITTLSASMLLKFGPAKPRVFTHIFIDEAAQATEPELVIPLSLADHQTTVVLAGDNMQLLPKVYSKKAKKMHLERSLLQRLYIQSMKQARGNKGQAAVAKSCEKGEKRYVFHLTTNYRSAPDVTEFLGKTFYRGHLHCSKDKAASGTSGDIPSLSLWVTKGTESQSGASFLNIPEALEVVDRVQYLIDKGVKESSIAVVTPFEGQMLLIAEMLKNKSSVKVDIVENMQGLEFDAVILSTVRTCTSQSPSDNLGFFEDDHLLNTAMARGRKYILVVGDPYAMCSLGKCCLIWKDYIDSCRSKGSINPELTNDDIEEILHHDDGLLEKRNEQDEPAEDHHQETASTIVTDSTAKDSGYSSISESGTACSLESDSEDQDEGFSDEEIFQNLKKEWKTDAENGSKLPMDEEEITFEAHGASVGGNTWEKLTVDSWLLNKHRNAISSYEAEMEAEDGDDDDDDDGDIQRNENFEDFFDSRWDQRENYYVHYSKTELEGKLRNYPEKYKLCTLHLEKTHKGYAVPTERSEEIPKINLYGRSSCGMAFDKTEVVVELDNPPVGGKISLNDDYHGKVVGTWNQVRVRKFTKFVCTVDEFNIDLMRPLNKIVPYIHICNPNEGKTGKSIAVYARGTDDRFSIKKRVPVNLRQRDNQVFVVRYLKWGKVFQYPLGIVVKVLPAGTDFQNAMDILKIQYSLTRKFPRPVVKQMQSIIKSLRPVVPEDGQSKSLDLPDDHFAGRDDLRNLHCFTIDPNHSKDLDDALSVQFCEDESVSIGVHIADISALVKPDDPIDSEARERSATFYPTRGKDEDDCIESPYYMLPDELSTNLCSLIEGKDRLAISIFFNFDKRGKINPRKQEKFPDIRKTVIRSRKKLSYDDTEEMLSGFGEEDHVMDSLKILSLAAAHLRHDRLGEAAQFMQHSIAKHPLSHRIIEEFMILSNAKIAEALSRTFKHVPLRVHFPPDKETQEKWQMEYGAVARKTYCLMRFVKDSDKSHHQLPDFITVRKETWQQLLNLAEMKSPKNRFDITRCLALEEDYPMKACARAAWIDIQRQAKFVISDPDDTSADYSHFDLHLPIYGQWTSPIRRYMDIIMQRLLCDMLDGKTQPSDHSYRHLEKMNQTCSVYNENYSRWRLFDKDCQVLKACLELQKCGQTSYSPVVTQVEESSFTLKNLDMTSIPRKFTRVRFGTLGLMDAPDLGRHNDVSFKWLKRLFNKKPEILSEGSGIPKNKESFKLNPYHGEVLIPIKVWDDFQNPEFWLKDSMQTKIRNIVRYNQDYAARFNNYVSGDMPKQDGDGTDTNILPECKMELHIETGNVLQTLISSSIRMGKLIPSIQLLNITPHFSICLAHRDNPVKMFSDEMAAHPLQEQYRGIEHYKNVLLPVLAVEFATCAVANDDAVTIQNVDIAWEKQDIDNKTVYFGAFTLGDRFCEERNIEFSYEGTTEENVDESVDLGRYYDYICIVYSRKSPLSQGGQKVKSMSSLCNVQSSPFWTGHGLLMKVGKNKRVLFKLLTESLPDAIFEQDESDEGELTCCVELIQKTLPDRRMEDAVYELEKATDLAQSIACGNVDLNSEIMSNEEVEMFLKRFNSLWPYLPPLNRNQASAVDEALSKPFTLIQGPPGTGKSWTGIRIVYLFVKKNKIDAKKERTEAEKERTEHTKQVLYCGPSNKSVDVVTGLLKTKLGPKSIDGKMFPSICPKIVRVYGETVVQQEFPVPFEHQFKSKKSTDCMLHKDVALHHIIRSIDNPFSEEIRKLDSKFREYFKNPNPRVDVKKMERDVRKYKEMVREAEEIELRRHDVILCTCSVSSNPRIVSVTNFEQCIVDECGMCTEADSLIPIVSSRAKQVVLIGDHKQLRPIVLSRAARDLNLETSLFERYAKKGKSIMLDIQYRMHRDIVEFPSKEFYECKLQTRHSKEIEEDEESSLGKHVWQYSKRYRFCHVEGQEETLVVETPEGGERSKWNKKEMDQVVRLYGTFVKGFNISKKRVIVLSQYRAQVSRIQEELSEKFGPNVNVSTVVQSQGGEWDIVIFTTVRSLPQYQIIKKPTRGWWKSNLGFITDEHQINVALTRARKGLIIIGNKHLLGCHPVWSNLLDHYQENNALIRAEDFLPEGIRGTEFYKSLPPRLQRKLIEGTFYGDGDSFPSKEAPESNAEDSSVSEEPKFEDIRFIGTVFCSSGTAPRIPPSSAAPRIPPSSTAPRIPPSSTAPRIPPSNIPHKKTFRRSFKKDINTVNTESTDIPPKTEKGSSLDTLRKTRALESAPKKDKDLLKDTFLRKCSVGPEGGEVHLDELGMFLLIPPGALTETCELFIGISWREEDMPPLPKHQTRASPVVVCGPHGIQFNRPVYLSFHHCISGTRYRKKGKVCPARMDTELQGPRGQSPFHVWHSQTHLDEACRWKELTSDNVVVTCRNCILIMDQFCKHTMSCDSIVLCALVFGSYQPNLLKLAVYCVNDTPDQINRVENELKEKFMMEMLAPSKSFEFYTCRHSEAESSTKKSFDVSVLLEKTEIEWNMDKGDSKRKVMKYMKLVKSIKDYITFALKPKVKDLDVFVCNVRIQQEGQEGQEEDFQESAMTDVDIHWKLPICDDNLLGSFSGNKSRGNASSDSLPNTTTPLSQDYATYLNLMSTCTPTDQIQQGRPALQARVPVVPQTVPQPGNSASGTGGNSPYAGQPIDPVHTSRSCQQYLPEYGASENLTSQTSRKTIEPSQMPVRPLDTVPMDQGNVISMIQSLQSAFNIPKGAHSNPGHYQITQGEGQGGGDAARTFQGNPGNMGLMYPITGHHVEGQGLSNIRASQGSSSGAQQCYNLVQNNVTINTYNYPDREHMGTIQEQDVTHSFHKHVPAVTRDRLKEILNRDEVREILKKMYAIPELNSQQDVVDILVTQVEGCIASFIKVLQKMKSEIREGEEYIPEDLIAEVKEGLRSKMEYKKLKENKIVYSEDMNMSIREILDFLSEKELFPMETIEKLKNEAKAEGTRVARDMIDKLLAINPVKEPILHLKRALRYYHLDHIANLLEVQMQQVEEELSHSGGNDDQTLNQGPSSRENQAPPIGIKGQMAISAH